MTIEQTEVDTSVNDDAQADADFEAGAAMESPQPKTAAAVAPVEEKVEPSKPAKVEQPAAKPEYVQLTKADYERLDAAAKRTENHEQQMSKAFGTIGDMQKIVRTLQASTPRGSAVKIPDHALDGMKKDYPELAEHLEGVLKSLEGTGGSSAEIDVEGFKKQVNDEVMRLQVEELEDDYPDWKQIVGAVDTRAGQQPDPNNPFRKWLATQDAGYQARVNATNSAGIIARAIRKFQAETTKAAPKPNPQAQTREQLIKDSIRPKGDGGQPPMRGADDDFEAGFRAG